MKVAVAGGTGVVGRLTVEAVRGNGDEPVVLARSTGVELVSGNGLAQALAGAGAVIDVSNIAATRASVVSEFFEATSRNLMRAAAQAGVGHIVALSIVGVDHVPFGYYEGKLRQEEVLAEEATGSPVPVSILRAAQFHEFPGQYLARSSGRFVVVPKWRTQPVAAREVATALAALARASPVAMLPVPTSPVAMSAARGAKGGEHGGPAAPGSRGERRAAARHRGAGAGRRGQGDGDGRRTARSRRAPRHPDVRRLAAVAGWHPGGRVRHPARHLGCP